MLTTHYVDLGAMAATYDGFQGQAMDLEAGFLFGHSPVGAHFALALGDSKLDGYSDGTMYQVALGPEVRHCLAAEYTCVFGGVDVGFMGASAGHLFMDYQHDNHAVAIPRAGFVVGGEHVAFVATVEVPVDISGTDRGYGVTGTGGVMIRW